MQNGRAARDKKARAVALVVVVAGASAVGIYFLFATQEDPRDVVQGLLDRFFSATCPGDLEGVFDPVVTGVMSLEELYQWGSDVRAYYGNYSSVAVTEHAGFGTYYFNVSLQWSSGLGVAHLNDVSKHLDGLFLVDFTYNETYLAALTWDEVYAKFDSLPGNKSLIVQRNDTVLHSEGLDQQLAVASTFKLFVLDALASKVDADPSVEWGTTLAIRDDWKSLPSGILQTYPAGTELTLRQFADYMVNISDNTATDHLINFMGREYVESFLPAGYDLPLLTTSESFKLRYLLDDGKLAEYLSLDESSQRAFLAAQVDPLNVSSINVTAVDWGRNYDQRRFAEWYFNASSVLDELVRVRDLPSMQMNPGLAHADNWQRVAYKGGSDAGVLSFAHALQAANGTWFYCVVLANNPENFDVGSGFYIEGQVGLFAVTRLIIQKLNT
ncbi:MAG: serine hydrolase [Promethearchaeota archaeon]